MHSPVDPASPPPPAHCDPANYAGFDCAAAGLAARAARAGG
jgi:hypothetical protein